MSLQVKFPFGRGHAPLHTCGTCGYMTRHRAMFERHIKHCNDKTVPTSSAANSSSQPLPSPPVCRNYRCEKCGFATSKSQHYLQHRRETHGENFSIYPCDQCEYASRHKSKVIRHRNLVHRDVPTDPTFPKELDHGEEEDVMDSRPPSHSSGDGSYKRYTPVEEEDIYMRDENQNTTPVKRRKIKESEDEEEEASPCSSPEDLENSPNATFVPDPTENAYGYIATGANDIGAPSFSCTLCQYNNTHKWKVATHVRNVHMRKTLFKCPHCEFVTERKIEWCVHKTTHTEKVVHACQDCSYRTTMKRNFERHLGHHNLSGPFRCTICSYSSTGEAAVQRHMAEYHPTPDKQLALDSIHTSGSKTTSTNSPLPSPVVIGTLSIPKEHVPRSRTIAHMHQTRPSSGQEVQCRICSVWFKNETRLRIHMVAHSDEAPHVCTICKLRYKRPADMNRHMKRKHGATSEDIAKANAAQAAGESESDQEMPLDLCMKKSDDESDGDPNQPLDLSCKSSSSPSPTPAFRTNEIKCSYCSYMAKWPSDLRRHMLVHSVEKRFRCQVCNKRYKYQFDLNMHMRKSHRMQSGRTRVSSTAAFIRRSQSSSRHNPKESSGPVRQLKRTQSRESKQRVVEHFSAKGVPDELKCSHCEYIGKYRAEVERHETLHTGPQPYLCLFCTYRTFWKGDVKRHLLKHHRTEVDKYGELPELVNLCYKPEPGMEHLEQEPDAEMMEDEEVEKLDEPEEVGEEGTSSKKDLYQEMAPYLREISGRKLFKCPNCNLAYDYPSKLRNHMEIHGDLKRYMCPHCGKRSNWRWDICKHISSHHPTSSPNVVELTEDEARATLDDYINSLPPRSKSNTPVSVPARNPVKQEIEQDPVQDLEAYVNMQGLDDYARVMNPDSIEDDMVDEKPVYKKPHSLLDSIPGGVTSLTYPDSNVSTLVATVAAGRYRKFKCSSCGKRSNWKWDIRKHIRSSHASADIIEMTEEEAKATFHEILQNKPKEDKDVYKFNDDTESQDQALKPKWRPFKCPKCGKRSNWKWDLKKHMIGCAPGVEMIVLSEAEAEATFVSECSHYVDKKQESPSPGIRVMASPEHMEESRNMPSLKVKKYKCSLCPYRSDYRSDISRHLKRKHYKVKGKILVLGADYAAATLPGYKETWAMKKFVISPEKARNLQEDNEEDMENCIRVVDPEEDDRPRHTETVTKVARSIKKEMQVHVEIPYKSTTPSRSPNKVWQCSRCEYRNGNKMVVINHFKTHGQGRAFQCKVCAYTSDYRGSIYRHVKSIHKRNDYQNVISYCALMEVDNQSPPMEHKPSKQCDKKDEDSVQSLYVVKMYQCLLCPSKTIHKHNLIRHIKEKHPEIIDPHSNYDEVETVTKRQPTVGSRSKTPESMENGDDHKTLQCDLCPFKSSKQGLLKIHQQYHKAQNVEQFKCKYCPYYITTMRRLMQHMKLHKESRRADEVDGPIGLLDSPEKPSNSTEAGSPRSVGKARHFCDKCPYVSINKNDFIYHKQFHRPKPAAPFKCDFCPYWVSLRRLLTQHKKVHSPEYKLQYYPRDMLTPQDVASPITFTMPLVSPSKSDRSDTSMNSESMVQVAHIKQQIITSKITTVPITPKKLKVPNLMDRADDTVMSGYIVDPIGRVITNKSYHKMHTCQYCPYTNVRYANLRLHEKMHGRGREDQNLHQCNYCDYQVSSKGLLNHHIKVHSTQYEPGYDEINDVELMDENEEFLGKKKSENSDEDEEEEDEENNNSLNTMKFPEREAVATNPAMVLDTEQLPNHSEYYIKMDETVGGPVLEKAMLKKWCCEQCPYATLRRTQFEKHILLHGSKQKYACEYCDYSVPGYHLLLQHKKLHMLPNPNLLSVQSISNLQRLPEVAADIAAAAQIKHAKLQVHDNMDLYENSPDFTEPKRLFRCDRCPYSNTRRDHLLSHLKFHMISSEMKCPYCDYSVSKVHLLNQHIKVHFSSPGTEMSAEPKPKTNSLETEELDQPDFFTALKLKQKVKPQTEEEQATDLSLKSPSKSDAKPDSVDKDANDEVVDNNNKAQDNDMEASTSNKENFGDELGGDNSTKDDDILVSEDEENDAEMTGELVIDSQDDMAMDTSPEAQEAKSGETENVCEFCERSFSSSRKLKLHVKCHLIGSV